MTKQMIPEAAARFFRCLTRGHLWTSERHCARCSKGIPRKLRPSGVSK